MSAADWWFTFLLIVNIVAWFVIGYALARAHSRIDDLETLCDILASHQEYQLSMTAQKSSMPLGEHPTSDAMGDDTAAHGGSATFAEWSSNLGRDMSIGDLAVTHLHGPDCFQYPEDDIDALAPHELKGVMDG